MRGVGRVVCCGPRAEHPEWMFDRASRPVREVTMFVVRSNVWAGRHTLKFSTLEDVLLFINSPYCQKLLADGYWVRISQK